MYKSHAKVPAPQTLVYSLLYSVFVSKNSLSDQGTKPELL